MTSLINLAKSLGGIGGRGLPSPTTTTLYLLSFDPQELVALNC